MKGTSVMKMGTRYTFDSQAGDKMIFGRPGKLCLDKKNKMHGLGYKDRLQNRGALKQKERVKDTTIYAC